MIRTLLTLALSVFSLSSLSSLSSFASASSAKAPTYVCTTLDNIDRFDTNATAVAIEFPEKWFRTSYNGACVYDCEPYQAIGDLNVGFHVSCGTLDTSKMVEMDMLPGMVTVPPYLYSDYSDGTFKSFVGAQEYTICVYKNSTIEGEGGDCGYREDITRAIKKALPPKTVDTKTVDTKTAESKKVEKYRIAYNKLRHIHSKLLQKYNQNPSKVILEKMKKVRAQMKVLLVLMH